MTIRARLSCWYAGVLFLALVAMGGLAYNEFVIKARSHPPAVKNSEADEAEEAEDFSEVIGMVLWCGLPAAVLGLAGGWWLTRKALSPVAAITSAAAQINERNLAAQLPRSGNGDELDRLTEVFNSMTGRLNDSFQRIREFTLHASHELKTPLTVLHAEFETALEEPALAPAQRERLLSQLDEVQRLTRIVDSLTLLTKADAGLVPLKRGQVPLDDLVRESHACAQLLARPGRIEVKLAACEAVSIQGDRHRLRQLLLNLVDNAIKYNRPDGCVTMALFRARETAELAVTNTGPGIPPEQLARVFDRFYRGDASHNNEVDGCGLGLSIAQWIVKAHAGTIGMTSQPGGLTTVTVRLPLSAEVKSA
jgi:signal transduction histidine kinase